MTEGRCEGRGRSGCQRNSHLQHAHPTEIFSDNWCCARTCHTLSIPLPSPSHYLPHPLPHLPFASHLPTMAAPGYVGSVGRSASLMEDSPNTCQPTKNILTLGESTITSTASIIQCSMVSCFSFLFDCFQLNLFQGCPVVKPVRFSHLEHHPLLLLPNLMMIGPFSCCMLASSWPKSSTPQHHSQTMPSIHSSTSGTQC